MDREKVIKGLECCLEIRNMCLNNPECPYNDPFICEDRASRDGCMSFMMRDALALLKAQEPKQVHVTADISYRKVGECPNCGKLINSNGYPYFCGTCGQAVKWDG